MTEYKWYQRAKCGNCGSYLWTTAEGQSVQCACNESGISSGTLVGQSVTVINETEFNQAVCTDEHYLLDEILIIYGGT